MIFYPGNVRIWSNNMRICVSNWGDQKGQFGHSRVEAKTWLRFLERFLSKKKHSIKGYLGLNRHLNSLQWINIYKYDRYDGTPTIGRSFSCGLETKGFSMVFQWIFAEVCWRVCPTKWGNPLKQCWQTNTPFTRCMAYSWLICLFCLLGLQICLWSKGRPFRRHRRLTNHGDFYQPLFHGCTSCCAEDVAGCCGTSAGDPLNRGLRSCSFWRFGIFWKEMPSQKSPARRFGGLLGTSIHKRTKMQKPTLYSDLKGHVLFGTLFNLLGYDDMDEHTNFC